jgi:hypothetical protein
MIQNTRFVILEGGLGNQLWQLAFAHRLIDFGRVKLIQVYNSLEAQRLSRASLIIEGILNHCTHGIEFEKKTSGSALTRFRFVPQSNLFIEKRRPYKKFIQRRGVLDSRSWRWQDKLSIDLSAYSKFFGYYQNIDLLRNQVDIVTDEIIKALQLKDKDLDSSKEFNSFIHIRGKDYLEQKHRDTFGNLAPAYYEKLLRENFADFRSRPMIFSDDPTFAKSILPDNAHYEMQSPELTDEWETFALMASAKLACIANSSFSWWSGMVVRRRGGRIISPFPWTKSEQVTQEIINYNFESDFEKRESIFQ